MVASSGHNSVFRLTMDECGSECDSGKRSLNRLQRHIHYNVVYNDTVLFLFQYLLSGTTESITKLCKESVSEYRFARMYTRLWSASAQLEDFTVPLLSLHCGTWTCTPWRCFERPRI